MKKSELVYQVLESSKHSAPEMTHALCALGEGDMGTGIVKFWKSGQSKGAFKGATFTALAFSVGISVCVLYKFHKKKLEESKRNAAEQNPNDNPVEQNKPLGENEILEDK